MRLAFAVGLLLILGAVALAGCRAAELCGSSVSCGPTGGYETCSDGDRCRILATDGNVFECPSCSDCRVQLSAADAWCKAYGAAAANHVAPTSDMAPATTQSKACSEWLTCAAQYLPTQLASLQSAYGANGSCWQGGAALATSCTQSCMVSLDQARMNVNSPPVCRP